MYGNFPKPAVSAVIFNEEKKLLLTLRSEKVISPGTWCLPGGHLDGGMTWEEAVCAEVKEEVGLTVVRTKLMGLYSDPKIHRVVDTRNGNVHHFVVMCFLIEAYSGKVEINDECTRFGWFSKDEIPSPLLQTEPPKVEDAFRYRGTAFLR